MTTPPVVGVPLWSRPRRLRLFASTRHATRARRPTDALLLVSSVLAVLVIAWRSAVPTEVEAALLDLAESLPVLLEVLWSVVAGLAAAWVLVLVLASLVRRRPDILRDLVLAMALSVGLAALAVSALLGGASATEEPVPGPVAPTGSISTSLALVAAATVVTSPHLTVPFRSLSRWLLGISAVGLVVLGASAPSGAVLGILCGMAAAAAVHLALGSSGGQPSLDEVRDALGELGVDALDLSEARRQTSGMYLVEARDTSGSPLVIRVFGRDAWDAQILAKAWRALWYRDASAVTLTRLQQAEHEAFITLLAARAGVPVEQLVTAGRSAENTAVVVIRHSGTTLRDLPAEQRAQALPGMWDAVLRLSDAGISHGNLGFDSFVVQGDEVVVTGLGGASVSASGDQRRIDLAQLLVTGVLVDGVDGAVAEARRRLGPEALAAVAPYLQVAALGRSLRPEVRAAGLDLDEVRAAAALAADVEAPSIARLRRVSAQGLVTVALLSLAAYTIISLLGGVDWADVVEAMSGAQWSLVVLALVVGQLPRLAQGESTRGACPRPLPFGPVALLQFAICFISLVVPSSAARVGVNVRFFQKQGIPPAPALSIGLIDSLAGFAVQLFILFTVLTFGSATFDLDLDRPQREGDLLAVLVVLLALVLIAGAVALAIPSVRRRVADRVRPWVAVAKETLSSLRSITKVAQLFGGNLAAEVLFAATLGLVLLAFDTSLSLGTLLVIVVGVALFSGLMPIPGSIGVAEGALMVGMMAAGVDEATAFAAAITYRMVTFYLPPIWGGVALRRMERDGLL
ncbi:MAG TPA: lysylphosphatidylglycerol synthase transmembrane domain-containing protein [Actinotalea sp.]|nr:lysylphosphatidylglycerol synthase transmembrane domain-containing protein [Actinotalea sp.]